MLLQMTKFHSFYVQIFIVYKEPICLSVDTQVEFLSWLLWIAMSVNMCRCLFNIMVSFPLDIYPVVGWPDHVFPICWATFELFSIISVLIYIPTNSIFLPLHPHQHVFFFNFVFLFASHSNWSDSSLWFWYICLITSNVKYFWMVFSYKWINEVNLSLDNNVRSISNPDPLCPVYLATGLVLNVITGNVYVLCLPMKYWGDALCQTYFGTKMHHERLVRVCSI